MLHYTLCVDCENDNPNEPVWANGEIHSDLFAVCKCDKGHITIAGLVTELFDVLYKSAVDSYMKKCLSESVMSFAASLERAYELFIKIVLLRQSFSFGEIEEYWKEIKNQSERQYGAFCFCHLYVTKESWRIDSKMIEFRNKVVHKGYIATSEEVQIYADNITSCLTAIIKIIKTNFDTERSKLYFLQKEATKPTITKIMQKYPNAKYAASGNPSLLKWNYSEYESVTFEDSLNTAKLLIDKFGFSP